MENKFNWGTLILGIVIGAVVVGIIWAASKPAVTGGQADTCAIFGEQIGVRLQAAGVSDEIYAVVKDALCARGQ